MPAFKVASQRCDGMTSGGFGPKARMEPASSSPPIADTCCWPDQADYAFGTTPGGKICASSIPIPESEKNELGHGVIRHHSVAA